MNFNEEHFISAYEKYKDAIFRYCYFRLNNRELALDAVQDIFIRTWRYLAAGNEIENIRAFCYKTARNAVVDYVRKSKKVKEESLELNLEQGKEPAVSSRAEERVDFKLALEIINSLDEPYQEAVILRYIEGFSPQEIAEITQETANNISVRINRGLRKIKEQLQ